MCSSTFCSIQRDVTYRIMLGSLMYGMSENRVGPHSNSNRTKAESIKLDIGIPTW